MDNNREVSLLGNAFLKIRKGQNHHFKVVTNKTITTALGTSFTITENEILKLVKLHEGKEKMTKSNNFKNHVDFKKESVKSIISFLEEEYVFKIAVPKAFLSKQITLRIKKEEDIEVPLKIIAELNLLIYSIDRFYRKAILKKQYTIPTNSNIEK